MTADILVIVFGAGGRLGTRLLPLLAAEPVTVLAVARKNKPSIRPRGVHWVEVDVTNPDEWPRSLGALTGITGVNRHVVVVDLLLKRTTVTAMRTSIVAITSYILRLRDRLAYADQSSSLVAASTTATLAPWLYQTPYGLAKRRQLTRYTTFGISGTAFLLPSLTETEADTATRLGLSWTYNEAARRLATDIMRQSSSAHGRNRAFRLVVPGPPALHTAVNRHAQPANFRLAARRLLRAHLSLVVGQMDSPYQHREASHYRLALTPTCVRQHLDHHHAPPVLVRRLKRSLAVPVEIVAPEALPPRTTR